MEHLLDEAFELWHDTRADFPALDRQYSPAEQALRESYLDRFLHGIEQELRRLPRTRAERAEARERIVAAFVEFSRCATNLQDRHIHLLLDGGFSAVGTELGHQARRFDPDVPAEDILQACRNAWTACGLQVLFGEPMRVSPSVFAYSMLYPYSDNYMDAPEVPKAVKVGFSRRFGARLAGEEAAAANEREEAIWRLVGLIESQYARASYPQVYEGLLSIHRAQEESLALHTRHRSGNDSVDVARLCFQKGGTSVLADACLVRGHVSEAEAEFAFQWGILLQLADDLQDIHQDRENGVLTMFSSGADRETLDKLTSRTLWFGQSVMQKLDQVAVPGSEALKELVRSSSRSIVVRSAGQADAFHSSLYLSELERYSPFRFQFLRERGAQLARRGRLLTMLFDAFLAGDEDEPAFPLLPGSMMPRI